MLRSTFGLMAPLVLRCGWRHPPVRRRRSKTRCKAIFSSSFPAATTVLRSIFCRRPISGPAACSRRSASFRRPDAGVASAFWYNVRRRNATCKPKYRSRAAIRSLFTAAARQPDGGAAAPDPGRLDSLPPGTILDIARLSGATTLRSIGAGQPIAATMLRRTAIRAGQQVQIPLRAMASTSAAKGAR